MKTAIFKRSLFIVQRRNLGEVGKLVNTMIDKLQNDFGVALLPKTGSTEEISAAVRTNRLN
jgi:hypothetical protein